MLIFNEQTHFERLTQNGFPDKRINRRDMSILAKGWARMGCDAESIVSQLQEFCRVWCKNINPAKYAAMIEDTAREAVENSSVVREPTLISFSRQEMQSVVEVENSDAQRLYFILACIKKFYQRDFIYLNAQSSIQLSELCKLAKVKTAKKNQDYLLFELVQSGHLELSEEHILKFELPKVSLDTADDAVLTFEATDTMIEFFERWYKANYTHCARCKKLIRKGGNKTKYCPECAKKAAAEQRAEYAKRVRQNAQ